MLSKFKYIEKNKKFFYLTLEEYCAYQDLKILDIRNNINFWNLWLGEDLFDFDFLSETFKDYNNDILLCFQKNNKSIYNLHHNLEGVIVFNKLSNLFFNILLLAKKDNSELKCVGKNMLRKLNNILLYNLNFIDYIILSDVSDIPNYYSRLGFLKTNNMNLRKILDNYDDDIYYIKIDENNFKNI